LNSVDLPAPLGPMMPVMLFAVISMAAAAQRVKAAEGLENLIRAEHE
jgi:hypothetical protein